MDLAIALSFLQVFYGGVPYKVRSFLVIIHLLPLDNNSSQKLILRNRKDYVKVYKKKIGEYKYKK